MSIMRELSTCRSIHGHARLLEGEIKRLEDLCEESKQRRDEKQADVAVLDRKLTSLRAQEHHEAEVTRKLSKAYARARGVDTTRPGVMSLVHAYSSTFGSLWELARTLGPPDSPPRRRAPSPDSRRRSMNFTSVIWTLMCARRFTARCFWQESLKDPHL
ncbi:hypothetical protein BD779DRAFT_212093 [Infundibulicybe gibba]|nr:hypothetical protein BD779DRAFT_212093 [Infundibulicybe gibba]